MLTRERERREKGMSVVETEVTTFGEWLREARVRKGMSQEDLMYEARVRAALISAYENGQNEPYAAGFFRLVAALGEWPPMHLAVRYLTAKKEGVRIHKSCSEPDVVDLRVYEDA
jgi:transcriptional regulator with XRE-family HTH domain